MNYQLKAQPILEAALAGGGQWSELFVENSTGITIIMDDGKVEKIIGGVDRGAGLRLVYDNRTAYAHTNDQTVEGLMPLARNLASLAGGSAIALTQLNAWSPATRHASASRFRTRIQAARWRWCVRQRLRPGPWTPASVR
jgi:predicted Zn-dependent protease